MFNGCQPSAAFTETASRKGIKISSAPDRQQLAEIVNDWKAENVAYYQRKWDDLWSGMNRLHRK